MSLFSVVFYFVFGGNVLLQWGLVPSTNAGERTSPWLIPMGIASGAVAAVIDGMVFRYALAPWGLESMAPLVFFLILSGYFTFISMMARVLRKKKVFIHDETSFQATVVLYATAMMAGSRFSSPWLLLAGGAAAALGYLAATAFLAAIVDRMNLEPVPASFKGAPIRMLSAGLIALTFSGVDATFFSVIIN
jgi:Na+-translocating ferredoxin:NAD+ oxidoreductase subunit A